MRKVFSAETKEATLVMVHRVEAVMERRLQERDWMSAETKQAAIAKLLTLQRQSRILEKDAMALDFRVPGKVFVRLTDDSATVWAEAHAAKKGAQP